MPSSHESEGTLYLETETQAQLERLELNAHVKSFNGTCHEISIFVQTEDGKNHEIRVYQDDGLHLRNKTVVNMNLNS